jgi:hypothetical protein
MPALVGLAIVGIVGIVRAPARDPARAAVATARSLSLPVVAAALAVLPTLVIVYITPRYLADFLAALVLPAFAGFHVVLRWVQASPRSTGRRVVAAVVVVLAVWSVAANVGIARQYQNEHGADFFEAARSR